MEFKLAGSVLMLLASFSETTPPHLFSIILNFTCDASVPVSVVM
jgi:hypothetical protein